MDPEYFQFECLTVEEVEKLLNESVEKLSEGLQITPSLAKVLLHEHNWDKTLISDKYRSNASDLMVSAYDLFYFHLQAKINYIIAVCLVIIYYIPYYLFILFF